MEYWKKLIEIGGSGMDKKKKRDALRYPGPERRTGEERRSLKERRKGQRRRGERRKE